MTATSSWFSELMLLVDGPPSQLRAIVADFAAPDGASAGGGSGGLSSGLFTAVEAGSSELTSKTSRHTMHWSAITVVVGLSKFSKMKTRLKKSYKMVDEANFVAVDERFDADKVGRESGFGVGSSREVNGEWGVEDEK